MPVSDDYRLGRALITAGLSGLDMAPLIEDATEEERRYALFYLAASLVTMWNEMLDDPLKAWQEILMIEEIESWEDDEDDN